MLILTIRTDKPEAELALSDNTIQRAGVVWTAHRQLAETLHSKIRDLVAAENLTVQDLQGIACYAGPGSFTGLRIGLSVGNALAYACQLPIVAEAGDGWQHTAALRLMDGQTDTWAVPDYGADVHITKPKHINRPANLAKD